MHFASDNWAGAHPAIARAVLDANEGNRRSYGSSQEDKALEERFSDLFETQTRLYLVATGTAANALALSTMARPGAVVFCHEQSHVRIDECGAPLFFAPGMQLEGVGGTLGRIDADALQHAIETVEGGGLNAGRASGLTLTQLTESGTLYTADDIKALSGLRDIPVHMDGARFANALVALECTPAEMTWKSGIDMVSFGGTKNGCWMAEALLVFDPDLAQHMDYLRKRSGHLVSKMRVMTSQFDAYLDGDLWLDCARHANAMAGKLAQIIEASPQSRLAWQPQANEIFAILPAERLARWRAEGLFVSDWQAPTAERHLLADDEALIRLVTSFATRDDEIDAVARLCGV